MLWKQRYFVKQGDDYVPLGVQWNFAQRKWLPYHVGPKTDWWTAVYPDDNRQRPTGPLCEGCHSVDYSIRRHQVAEWNVGCERCHGPGSEHAPHPVAENIVNPSRPRRHRLYRHLRPNAIRRGSRSPIRSRATTMTGRSAIASTFVFRISGNLRTELQDRPASIISPTALRTRTACKAMTTRKASSITAASPAPIVTTSTAHRTTHSYASPPIKSVLTATARPRRTDRTHRPWPRTLTKKTAAREASALLATCRKFRPKGVPGAMVHAHTFHVITPSMTEQYKIAKPCILCHADKTTAWAHEAMTHWPETSPWMLP